MIASRSRLFAASLTVLAAALAGGWSGTATAQETPPGSIQIDTPPDMPESRPEPNAHPPGVILEPDQTPGEAVPGSRETETPPVVTLAEKPETPAIPEVWAPVPTDVEGRSAYGLYLAGKVALMQGEGGAGADFLARANRLTPEQPSLRTQAFTSALLTGDLNVAAALAPAAGEAPPAFSEGGRLVKVVQDFVRGDARTANAALTEAPIAAPHARAGLMVAPWIAAAAGDWRRALQPAPTSGDALTLAFARLNRAQLLERRRDYDEAETEFKALSDEPQLGVLFHRPYGEFLERRRRPDEALALYEKAAAGPAADASVLRALERVRNRERAPALPSLREAAAAALTLAAAQASAERGNEFAAVYLRLALNLHDDAATRIRLAQVLEQGGLKAAARTVLAQVGPEDPAVYAGARAQLALSLGEAGDDEAAMEEIRRAFAAQPDNAGIALMMASQLLSSERYEEGLELLNGPLLNTAEQGAQILFLRGAAYESLERIPEAEAELWAAHQADPANANILNYLGYLWVDRGLRVEQGAQLIAQAHAAEPDNGNIQDSLGWAQYRQGQYATAVETLEQAVDKEPANAEISDHLGDAYWQVGREREARWLWNRVLTLEPDAERRASVEHKLENGLSAAPPADVSGQGAAR